MVYELKFHFDKKVTTEGLNDRVRITLKAQDPKNENIELTLTAAFPDGHVPTVWDERLGKTRGDIVLVSLGATNHQGTLDGGNEE